MSILVLLMRIIITERTHCWNGSYNRYNLKCNQCRTLRQKGDIVMSVIRIICISWWRHQMATFYALLTFVSGNHRLPVSSPHKGQWRGAVMFSLICAWTNSWANNKDVGDLRRHRAHYDVIVMFNQLPNPSSPKTYGIVPSVHRLLSFRKAPLLERPDICL